MSIRKINTLLVMCIMCFVIISNDNLKAQSVGIGDAADFTPNNSALLELRSIVRGFLMPQMTAAQKNAISNPAHGLMVVQTDNQPGEPNGIWYYDSIDAEWKNIFSTSSTVLFSDIQTGTNTTATMTVGSGASIVPTDGIVRANEFVNSASVSAAVDLNTSEVAGILTVDKGGTGTNVVPPAGGVIYSDGTTYSSTATGTSGQVLVSDGVNPPSWQETPLPSLDDGKLWIGNASNLAIENTITGDGTVSNAGLLTVTGIQGTAVDATPPTNEQILVFKSSSGKWEPSTPLSGGTVTSVGLDLPANVFSISGSPVTTSGTLTGTLIVQDKQKVFAGPVDDPSATPTFRLLEATDIPSLDAAKITTGAFTASQIPSLDASKITTGTFTTSQIPSLDASKITTGILPIARGGTNSGTALNNNRIIVSSGGSIVEAAALTNGQLLIGSTGAAPVAANITAATGSGVSVTNGAGTIALALTNNQSGSAWNTLGNSATTAGTNFIGTTDAVDLTIKTNNTEKMRITSSGNVGIGVSPTTAKLQISDATTTSDFAGLQINQTGAISGTGYGIFATKTGASTTNVGGSFSATGGTNNYGLLVPSGNVGIGTSAPTQKIELNDGNFLLSNSGTAGELRLQETNAFGTNYTGFKADTLTSNLVYTMPKDTVNELAVLVNYGTNKLRWLKTGDLQSQTRSNILEIINAATYSIPDTVTHVLVERSGVSRVHLYSGTQYSGKVIFIKRLSAGNGHTVEICPATNQQIDRLGNAKGFVLRNVNDALMMVYDGSNWWIMTAYLANNSIQLCDCP